MTFKDAIKSDLNVFLSSHEFADKHNVDGQKLLCVIDDTQFNERSRQPVDRFLASDGVYEQTKILYIRSEDYECPPVGYRMSLNNEYFYVTSVSEDMGILKITIVLNET